MTTSRPVGVITGGTQGIGRAAAEVLAADGWSVAVCSRHGDEAVATATAIANSHGVPTFGAEVDVRSAHELEQFASQVAEELGPPGAVLANAAVPGPVGPLHAVDLAAWASTVEIDLVGVANTLAAFGRGMVERGWGSLITMSGGGVGGRGIAPRMTAYTSSKAAVLILTETVAGELAEHGIKVNAIAPGAIPTRFMEPVLAAGPRAAGEQLFQQTTAQRADPDSLDGFVGLFRLLVDPTAPFITGRMLSARWDDPAELLASPPPVDSSLYRLRRIDGALFGELVKGA